eukprot:9487664-Pyramimonas_sp.AAC.1
MNTRCGPLVIHGGRRRAVEALHATSGLPAGDSNADVAINVHAAFELGVLVTRCPAVDFRNNIDDSAIGRHSRDMFIAEGMA